MRLLKIISQKKKPELADEESDGVDNMDEEDEDNSKKNKKKGGKVTRRAAKTEKVAVPGIVDPKKVTDSTEFEP